MKKTVCFLLIFALITAPHISASADAEESVRLPVIMYHHISTDSRRYNDYVLSLEEFKSDMDYLAENGWHSISMRQLLAWYDGEFTMPDKPFMISFDDGFESTLAYAEPILAGHGFTAVTAIIGSVCDRFSACDEHDAERSNLSWEDVCDMAERGTVEFQCHTWDMHSLKGRRGCARMKGEGRTEYISALSADLSRFLTECEKHGLDILPSIAYPYGEFDALTTEIIQNMDFRAAFTCEEKVNYLSGDREELFHLDRFNRPHGIASENFFKKWEENA